MAPIRRYLRITKYSVLEVRIHLERPSDAPWLLSSRDSVLPRIIEAVRPKVLPKLREENENARKKGGKKKKIVKDVVSQDDFEVIIFLTELSSRHSLLTKQKRFTDKAKLQSTGNKLTGWLNDSENPIHVVDEERPVEILQEDEDEDIVALADIPDANMSSTRKKRVANGKDDDDGLFVHSSDDDDDEDAFAPAPPPVSKRRKVHSPMPEPEEADDKKKLALDTSYDGFSIYGRILCLVVKRKGGRAAPATPHTPPLGGSQMMEQWVSTQAAQEAGLEDDNDT